MFFKIIIKILPLFILLSTNLFAQGPTQGFTDKVAVDEMKAALNKIVFKESQNSAFYDLVYQRMNWQIDPNVRYIKGSIVSYFKSKTDNLNSIVFDLDKSMKIDSVIFKKSKATVSRNQNQFTITLSRNLKKNELDSVIVFYQGEPPNSGFGSFTKSTHQNQPILWTLSEPYGAMEWWPCKQSLTDKIDSIDIIVTSPEPYRTASNGILVSETVKNKFRTMHWKHRYPIATYLVAISVTDYVNYSDFLNLGNGRKLEVLNYVYPEYLETAKKNTPVTVELITLFNKLIGEYPFAREKYGHAQFGWGGGMEHQTMSFMNNFGFELVAHELAHQWFGDYITLGSWQEIWLNEGFATYMSGLAYENLLDGKWWPQFKKVNLENIVKLPGGSVFVKDTANINLLFSGRLSYSKGAYLLHMLRWIMGDKNFFKGLQNYFNDPLIANGFARNHQLVKHMEMVGDTSLTEFFNDWYYGEGYPVYSVKYAKSVNNAIKISLSQTQSHVSVSFFEMPVPVRLYNESKTDSADFRLIHTKNNQEFILNPGFDVGEIKLDPDLWLVSKTLQIVKAPFFENSRRFVIYPNPFNEIITYDSFSERQAKEITLHSINGQLIRKLDPVKKTFNLKFLKSGVYILQIKTIDDVFEQQIIKL